MGDDARLVARLKRREARAWEELVDELVGETFALLGHLTRGNRELTEELNQEVWTSAIDRIASFDPERGELRVWILTIARHRVANHYRRRRNHLSTDEHQEELWDDALLPADVAHEVECAAAIQAALLCLNPLERRVLEGRYWRGESLAVIACREKRTEKSIEGLLARARGKMREMLRPYGCLEDERRGCDEPARR